MDSAQFRAWRKGLGFTQAAAAEALGLKKVTVTLYERGTRYEDGAPVVIPQHIALACAAISAQQSKRVPTTEAADVNVEPKPPTRVKRIRIEGPIEVLSIKGPLEVANRFKAFANSEGYMSYWAALRALLERVGH